MASGSDTHIGHGDGDTVCLSVSSGQRVRIIAGVLEGTEAVVVNQRTPGRVLVRVQHGVYVEIQQFCLEKIRTIKKSHD